MPQVIQGKVSYTRTMRPADFESKSATVELTFSVEDSATSETVWAYVDDLATQIASKAQEMVGEKAASKRQPKPSEKTEKVEKAEKVEKVRTKADIEVDVLAELDKKQPKQNISATPEDRKDPAQMDDLLSPPDDEPDVTDEALLAAVNKKQAKINNAPAIRELIGKYVAKPKAARDMTQPQRRAFLIELEKL